ncbi:hypothetical protein HK102_013378 [Quaeritorhiza haematococci]|nr:hypothetical protein HK102_013378 [Quaeritorhiza haematococci]
MVGEHKVVRSDTRQKLIMLLHPARTCLLQPLRSGYGEKADTEAMVRNVVETYVKCRGDEWREVEFASPSLKFKIIRDTMVRTGRRISNVDLTNILTVQDLIECVDGKWAQAVENPFDNTDSVRVFFEELRVNNKLPPNLYFMDVPKKKRTTDESLEER